jgi:hypothetical protein
MRGAHDVPVDAGPAYGLPNPPLASASAPTGSQPAATALGAAAQISPRRGPKCDEAARLERVARVCDARDREPVEVTQGRIQIDPVGFLREVLADHRQARQVPAER